MMTKTDHSFRRLSVATEALNQPLYDLSDHPKHAALVGNISARWNAIELLFLTLFVHLLRAPPWRAQPVFEAIVNRNARMEMIKALLDDMPIDPAIKLRLLDIVNASRIQAKQRNKFVHAYWIKGKRKIADPYILSEFSLTIRETPKEKVSVNTLKSALRKH